MNCYLLTGGLSSRMGRSKGDLILGEQTFVQRIVRASLPVFDRVVAVTRQERGPIGEIETIFEEPHRDTSPMYGIAAALSHAGSGRAWIIAVDYPLITENLLRFLSSRFERSEASLLVPLWRGKKQMLCAGYDAALAGAVADRVAKGEFRLQALTDVFETEYVEEQTIRSAFPGEPLWNVNRAEDYEAVRNIHEEE